MSLDGPPLRVCQVLSQYHPKASGAERQALAQGVELVRRGHIVHVVTQFMAGQPRDEVVQGVQIHRWINVVRVGPLFGLTFVASVIRSLMRLRQEFDLIHTHQGLWEAISTGCGRRFFGSTPTIVQPASSGYFGEAEELIRTKGHKFLRRLILQNSVLVAISADIAGQWESLGWPTERVVRLASGVDTSHFHPGPSLIGDKRPKRLQVVFTGRIHAQKNLDLLIDAWPSVVQSNGALLMLVGDGPELGRLKKRCLDLKIEEHVHFTGRVDDPADYLRAADVFVLPSVAEGMSNSLLEAMATGLPCIASDIGGNIDLLDGGVGLLVAANSSEWSAALIELLNNVDIRSAMGQASLQRVQSQYSLPHVVDRYIELYRRLLSRKAIRMI